MPNTSTNMGLIVPIASTGASGTGDPGPGYASNISSDLLNTIDSHDHSAGKGVQVTPAGLNINADLPMGSNNLTSLRAARFTSQPSGLVSAGDVGELYVKTGDLWYVNSGGTQIQLTAAAGLATGTQGLQGPVGVFTGVVSTPTALWQPTGSFSGSYKTTSWLTSTTLSSGSYTGVISYTPTVGRGATISMAANIVGYDGYAGCGDVDLRGTFLVASGAAGGNCTGVGTYTVCYSQESPQASGWNATLQPTGTQIALTFSVATGGLSGTVNFTSMLNVTERGTP